AALRRRSVRDDADRPSRGAGLCLRREEADGRARARGLARPPARRAPRPRGGRAEEAVRPGVLDRGARRLLRARARRREAAGRLALLEHGPPALERDRPGRARHAGGRPADGRRALVRLGCADDVDRRSRLQPARVPQRHRLAARQLPDRLGADALCALAGGVPDRAADAGGGRVLRPRAAGGLRRPAARADPLPDRVPDGRAAAGVGGGDPGAAAPGAARAATRPEATDSGDARAARGAVVGGDAAALRDQGVRAHLGRAPRRRPRPSRARLSMSDRALRIAVISPVWFPVPPTGYGGIEWIVWLLADGLVDAGHDVTLFASGDSHTKAKLAWVFETAPSARIGTTLPELHHCLACYERAEEFDVINDHSGLPAAVIGGLVDKPVLHTIHGPLDGEGGVIYEQIARVAPGIGFISVSMNQRKPRPDLPWVANCPNALDFSLYPVVPHRGDYLLFLGRMSPDKGCHRAIDVAVTAGLPLKIAGKRREPLERQYFEEFVEP